MVAPMGATFFFEPKNLKYKGYSLKSLVNMEIIITDKISPEKIEVKRRRWPLLGPPSSFNFKTENKKG